MRDGLIKIAAEYYDIHKNNQAHMKAMFVKFDGPLNSMIALYNLLVKEKEIAELESLPEETKQYYWDSVKDLEIEKDKKIKIAKAYYIFDILKK